MDETVEETQEEPGPEGSETGEPRDDPLPETPRPSVGPLSLLGAVFLVLTMLALIGTIVLLRYDTLVSGADEETIGDTQWTYIYMAAGGLALFAVLTIIDVLRRRGARA